MTVIEFFACAPIENMVSCFLLEPDKVIFVGSGNKERRRMEAHAKLAERMGKNTVFENITVKRDSLSSIVDHLEKIVNTEEECIFDLTGGDPLSLVATGIVYQRYKDTKRLQMHKYDFSTGKLVDCDGDGSVYVTDENAVVTVDEYITLHGGLITSKTLPSRLSEPKDLEALWSVCKKKPVEWNKDVSRLNEFVSQATCSLDGLQVFVNEIGGNSRSPGYQQRKAEVCRFLDKLAQRGLISDICSENGCFTFIYKNNFVKNCLRKAGNVLEYKMLSVACSVKDANGKAVFFDCMSGVNLDWDGVTKKDGKALPGSVNEIDLVMMDHLTPVFVSCKNGDIGDGELYKLSIVAERFSAGHCKKVLIASNSQKHGAPLEYFKQRADDLGIVLIDRVDSMTDDALMQALVEVSQKK